LPRYDYISAFSLMDAMPIFRRKTGSKPEEQLAFATQAQAFQNTESLFELATILSQQNEFAETLRIVALKAAALVNADVASIMMINPRTQNTVKTIMKEGKEISDRLFQFMHSNVSGAVMKSKHSLLISEVKTDSRFNKMVFKDTEIRSLMCVPFRSGDLYPHLAYWKQGQNESMARAVPW
jgi:transcriptional regulator with GAF, ATPase, and Fis domain